jgi:hypothetical protein
LPRHERSAARARRSEADRPDAAEVTATARGIASVVAPAGGLTDLQRMLLEALFPATTEHPVDLSHYEPMRVDELAEVLRPRNLAFSTRGVQVALLAALVLRPLPPDVTGPIGALAQTLGVDEGMLEVSLFETGYLRTGAGLFQSDLGHLSGHSAGHAMATPCGGAPGATTASPAATASTSAATTGSLWRPSPRRGARPVQPAAKVTRSHCPGAVGPWASGGISPFQLNAGRAMAAEHDREYASYGASPD